LGMAFESLARFLEHHMDVIDPGIGEVLFLPNDEANIFSFSYNLMHEAPGLMNYLFPPLADLPGPSL
jgi:hypothetical protein